MYIEVNGVKLGYDTFGSGNPLLLIHGWGGSKESLKKLGEVLSTSYRVYLIDLPGFGTSQPPEKDWEFEMYPQLVHGFIRKLNLRKVSLIGHSFGGGIGIYLAAHHPAMFEKLVLIGAAYYREPKSSTGAKIINKVIPFYGSIKEYFVPLRRIYYKLFHRKSDSLKFAHLEFMYRKILQKDLRNLLPKVVIPTLILWGELDLATPVHEARYLDTQLEDSKLIIYEDVGHGLPINNPDMIGSDILSFLGNYDQ